jgi:hypothetical protein
MTVIGSLKYLEENSLCTSAATDESPPLLKGTIKLISAYTEEIGNDKMLSAKVIFDSADLNLFIKCIYYCYYNLITNCTKR